MTDQEVEVTQADKDLRDWLLRRDGDIFSPMKDSIRVRLQQLREAGVTEGIFLPGENGE